MSDTDYPHPSDTEFDPESSPFTIHSVAGIPYKRGSEEDLAIRRVIAEAEAAKRGHTEYYAESSPFRIHSVEGIPYKRGSEEDLAIRRVIAEAEAAEAARKRESASSTPADEADDSEG
jgi:hypothetical protein